jgi:hypothetical protein
MHHQCSSPENTENIREEEDIHSCGIAANLS